MAGQDATVAFHNVLIGGCGAGVRGAANFTAVIGEHLTSDATDFWVQAQPGRIALTNSLIIGTLAGGPTLVSDHSAVNPAGPVFQPVGAGSYYLASASPYRRAGTTAVSSRLLVEFQQKSTQPPMALPAFFQVNGELTLGPQVERYTNGAPDYGFYYTAVDYTVAWLTNFGTITVLPGTTLGFRDDCLDAEWDYWTLWGLDLREGSAFVSHGTPNKPNVFVDVQFVQEQFTEPCIALLNPDFCPNDAGLSAPLLDLRFCNSYAHPQYCHVWSGNDVSLGILGSLDLKQAS